MTTFTNEKGQNGKLGGMGSLKTLGYRFFDSHLQLYSALHSCEILLHQSIDKLNQLLYGYAL